MVSTRRGDDANQSMQSNTLTMQRKCWTREYSTRAFHTSLSSCTAATRTDSPPTHSKRSTHERALGPPLDWRRASIECTTRRWPLATSCTSSVAPMAYTSSKLSFNSISTNSSSHSRKAWPRFDATPRLWPTVTASLLWEAKTAWPGWEPAKCTIPWRMSGPYFRPCTMCAAMHRRWCTKTKFTWPVASMFTRRAVWKCSPWPLVPGKWSASWKYPDEVFACKRTRASYMQSVVSWTCTTSERKFANASSVFHKLKHCSCADWKT